MGCDIHTNVEYRRPVNGKLIWIDGNEYEPNEYYGEADYEPEFKQVNKVAESRNYELFAVLANVRNYSNSIKPISSPRGIPPDCSQSVLESYKRWGRDAHSPSYFTLAELMHALPKYPILKSMVDQLQERYKILLPQDAPLVTSNDLRIVFWFDN